MKVGDSGKHFEINVRAVWGETASGGGALKLNEQVATMGMPGISGKSFTKIEEEIGEWWGQALQQEMLQAGCDERMRAIARGDFHEGVPAITVVGDGGWSKRSHKHTYNAPGGVAILVGAETGRLLHIGIKNKTCLRCTKAQGQGIQPKPHQCWKNWSESSSAMENAVILEGFQQAEATHGVRYMRYIGDGDASVFAALRRDGPSWCQRGLQKLECANHSCKGIRGKLEQLVVDHPEFKGPNRLTKVTRVRLVTAIRCAIKMRSTQVQSVGFQGAAQKLRHDILNAVRHVFGHHSGCSADFCKAQQGFASDAASTTTAQDTEEPCEAQLGPASDAASATTAEDTEEDSCDLMLEQQQLWQESTGQSAEELEAARLDRPGGPVDMHKDIIMAVNRLLQPMADKVDRLLGNHTTNLAETWMGLRTKFDGGKMINRCHRSSWNTRCYGAGLRRNLGIAWSPVVWERVTGHQASAPFSRHYSQRVKGYLHTKKSASKPEVKARARKRKQSAASVASSKRAKESYGPECTEVTQDVSAEDLQQLQSRYLDNKICISTEQIESIEKATQNQTSSPLWYEERRCRLTASNIHQVVKRNTKLPVCKLVSRLLYGGFKGNEYTRHGLAEEEATIKDYTAHMKEKGTTSIAVEPCGFRIHPQHHWLGASPDGVVCVEGKRAGLVEVKNVLKRKALTFTEAAQRKVANFCLEVHDGRLRLKRTHPFYYQVQCQLEVWDLEWADFVVRRTAPNILFVERVPRDRQAWKEWQPKLHAFYMKAILPELTLPRHNQQPGIREPGIWVCDYYEEVWSLRQTAQLDGMNTHSWYINEHFLAL